MKRKPTEQNFFLDFGRGSAFMPFACAYRIFCRFNTQITKYKADKMRIMSADGFYRSRGAVFLFPNSWSNDPELRGAPGWMS